VLLILILAIVGGVVYLRTHRSGVTASQAAVYSSIGCGQTDAMFARHESGSWVIASGIILRLQPDTGETLRHQHFIISCSEQHTLLVVNDISVGQRVPARPGIHVVIRGIYVWNAQGGLIHWTHHDPSGAQGGWILFDGRIYALESGVAKGAQ
jgi:hypothetical protein